MVEEGWEVGEGADRGGGQRRPERRREASFRRPRQPRRRQLGDADGDAVDVGLVAGGEGDLEGGGVRRCLRHRRWLQASD